MARFREKKEGVFLTSSQSNAIGDGREPQTQAVSKRRQRLAIRVFMELTREFTRIYIVGFSMSRAKTSLIARFL